ncbi:MAG TPA: ABC transporter ATP-binding protein [Solirubrobacteraceae bacterium]|nr:ABC transporter ATP-binding protein [Solirubrobacteraceae bacterium]
MRQSRGGRQVLAIDELDVAAGERLAVLGRNGAGKTTLLRLLAGLEAPAAGSVEIDGVPMHAASLAFRRQVGYATQRAGLLSATVIRNVELPLRWRGVDAAGRRRVALAALERLNIAGLADRKALSLSGGEAQRVSLALAFALEPRLLLLDEPAAGLDAEARRAFLDDLESALRDRATTVVHVSHRADEALRLADRVMVLVDGAIRQLSDPATLVQRPVDATVARLIGYENVVSESGGRTTFAVWASDVRIGTGPLQAVVDRVSLGPGRWEVVMSAHETIHAHLPLDQAPPHPGERVTVDFKRVTPIR